MADDSLVAIGQAKLTSLAAATAFTITPPEATHVRITAATKSIRYREDGVDPTATVGTLVAIGGSVLLQTDPTKFRIIETAASASAHATFYSAPGAVFKRKKWPYRIPIEINNDLGGRVKDHIVTAVVPYDAMMKPLQEDVRFTDNDGVTPIHGWREIAVAGVDADWRLRLPIIPAATKKYTIYAYFGNPDANDLSTGQAFDIWDDFNGIPLKSGYTQPAIENDGTDEQAAWGCPTIDPLTGDIHFYYGHSVTVGVTALDIHHAVSKDDGLTFVKDKKNPIISKGVTGAWDDKEVWEGFAWVLPSGEWRMLFTGRDTGNDEQIGLATSTGGPEGPWKKHPDNPVIPGGAGGRWNADTSESMAGMYVGDRFYAYVNTLLQAGDTSARETGIYYSDDDGVTWTEHSENPILTETEVDVEDGDGAFEASAFKYGDFFYLMFMHYVNGASNLQSEIWMYRSVDPLFPVGNRQFMGNMGAVELGQTNMDKNQDTPIALCKDRFMDLNDSPKGDAIWVYSAGLGDADDEWQTFLRVMPLWKLNERRPRWRMVPINPFASRLSYDQGEGKFGSLAIMLATAGDEFSIDNLGSQDADVASVNYKLNLTGHAVGCWMKFAASVAGDLDMYCYNAAGTLTYAFGFDADSGEFHYYNGGFVNMGDTYTDATWYFFEMQFYTDAGELKMNVLVYDEALAVVDSALAITNAAAPTEIAKIAFRATTGITGEGHFDGFRIRPFINANAATATVGTAEAAPVEIVAIEK